MDMNLIPKIFLVDDDPAIRSSLIFALELEGFAVEAFRSGEEMLGEDRLPQDGCLVLDYRLPGIDGLALLAALRRRGVTLPAVVITSTPTRFIRAQVADAGAVIIEKPLLCDALTAAIRKQLKLARLPE